MPLFYYARQSSLATKEGAKLWHLSLKKVGRAVDAQQLAEVIAEKSSLTPGDVHNVIRNLMTVMRSQLLNSRTVRLDGLGTFTMKARTRGKGVAQSGDCFALPVYSGIYAPGCHRHYACPAPGCGV